VYHDVIYFRGMRKRRDLSSPVCYAGFLTGPNPASFRVRIKRVREPSDRTDGARVLIARAWPKGITKEQARLDLWARDLAPTSGLMEWFRHSAGRWQEFRRRYLEELEEYPAELAALKLRATKRPLTLLYVGQSAQNNHATVLAEAIGHARLPDGG